MVSNQQFRLKWNNHRNTVLQEFETLLNNNSFVDCTIGADGKYLKAHKIVLSACSPYLQNVFAEHFDKHPVILLKDVSFKELKCMIEYMYCGEVNISECELPSFLRTAQSLKIKGLAEDINEYDSASDNEHQEISNLTENGRTVEPNVEIHDDEGPPIKKNSAPSLIYSNFAGRKRKSPTVSNSSKSSNNDKILAPISNKLTSGNVPSCADMDTSDNVCTTSKDNSHTDDKDSKKNTSQDDHNEVKNKTEVKEEPVDGDDDNSSFELRINPCEDSDPLNEDSESNCANQGKNFNEVSIASVQSCNEGEANDDDRMEIKEEILTEEVLIPEDHGERVDDEDYALAMPSDSVDVYVVNNEDDNEISVVKMNATTRHYSSSDDTEETRGSVGVTAQRTYGGHAKYVARRTRRISARAKNSPNVTDKGKPSFRKILPAPMKPTTVALPSTSLGFGATTSPRMSVPYRMIVANADVTPLASEDTAPGKVTDDGSASPRIILLNPAGRVVVLNSDAAKTVGSLPRLPNETKASGVTDAKSVEYPSTTKFRRIAPLLKEAQMSRRMCKACFRVFDDADTFNKHESTCTNSKGTSQMRRGRRKPDT